MPVVSELTDDYSPELLTALEQAYDNVWTTLYAHMPAATSDQSVELQIRLNRTLVALAAEGVTDPAELRRKALETMALDAR
jgi:hypothetical protein